VDVLDNLIFIN